MKTAVSVPDELFRQAEAAAKKLRMSRSKLYATALAEYLDRKRSKTVTERLNAYYSRHPAKIDQGLMRAQIESLDEKW
jgi:metal-responsive CopG/Arc/MetJ family transcriptional regulator